MLTEREILYAMANSDSNASAARFLGVTVTTYKKYAVLYTDLESGKTLWDKHFNQLKKFNNWKLHRGSGTRLTNMNEILDGKHPNYNIRRLKGRLFTEGYKEEKCELCGFCERRITDYQVPLILAWKDGNQSNHSLDNLEILCYNCYMLTIAPRFGTKRYSVSIKYHEY